MIKLTCPQMQEWFTNLCEHPGVQKPEEDNYFIGAYDYNHRLFCTCFEKDKLKVAQEVSRMRNNIKCHKIILERPNKGIRIHTRIGIRSWDKQDEIIGIN